MTVDDIFSCIGGHSIGAHNAGMKTVRFCEKDPWRREVLERKFPGIEIDDDITTAKPTEAEILIGGPPCQKTAGIAAVHGNRTGESLWPDMLRLVRQGSYRWVVVEQPYSAGKAWLAQVKADLEGVGYNVRGAVFSAFELGAPHTRKRMYAIAHPDMQRLEVAWRAIPQAIECVAWRAAQRNDWPTPDSLLFKMDAGLPPKLRKKWIEALGDSNPPQMIEAICLAIKDSR